MNVWSRWLACVAVATLPGAAAAATLSLSPPSISVTQGDGFSVELSIADLAGAEVGGFDVDLAFNPTLIGFSSATFSTLLGDEALNQLLTDVVTGTGTVNVAAVSLLTPQALDALQSDPILLATLHFVALGAGSGSLAITSAELSDALAVGIPLGAFTPVPVQVAVPEPTAWLPVGIGIAGMLWRRRREA